MPFYFNFCMHDSNQKQIWNAEFFTFLEWKQIAKWMHTRFSFLFMTKMIQNKQQVVFYLNSLWFSILRWTKNTKMQKKKQFLWIFLFINETNASKMNDAKIEWTWFRSLRSDTNDTGWKSGLTRWLMEAWMDRPNIW